MQLTTASLQLFLALARDAGNWSGCPIVNLSGPRERGNLTDLKQKDLIYHVTEDRGDTFIGFTEKGKALAAEHGVDVSTYSY